MIKPFPHALIRETATGIQISLGQINLEQYEFILLELFEVRGIYPKAIRECLQVHDNPKHETQALPIFTNKTSPAEWLKISVYTHYT